jgi:anti-sigma-K factor RskA
MTPDQLERVGEYVLGLMSELEAARFEQDMRADPSLAAAVDRLQNHLAALDDTARPVEPGSSLWPSIESALSQTPAHAPSPTPRLSPRNLSQWYAMAASVVVALGIGYLAGSFSSSGTRQPVMIAVLVNDTDASPGAIVEAFADDSVRLIPLDRFEVPQGRILQVWTLPDPETGPVSLGTFSDPTAINLSGPDLPPPETGQLYEITLEPAPGSPTGLPTGPILVKGFAKAPQ